MSQNMQLDHTPEGAEAKLMSGCQRCARIHPGSLLLLAACVCNFYLTSYCVSQTLSVNPQIPV